MSHARGAESKQSGETTTSEISASSTQGADKIAELSSFPPINSLEFLKGTLYFLYSRRELLVKRQPRPQDSKEDKNLDNYFAQAVLFIDGLLQKNPMDTILIESRIFSYCQKLYLSDEECDALLKQIDKIENTSTLPRAVIHFLRAKLFIFKNCANERDKYLFKGMEENCLDEINYLCNPNLKRVAKTYEEIILREQILTNFSNAKPLTDSSLTGEEALQEAIQKGDSEFEKKNYLEAINFYIEVLHSRSIKQVTIFDVSTLKKLAESYRYLGEETLDLVFRNKCYEAGTNFYLHAEWITYTDFKCNLNPDSVTAAINCAFKARDLSLKDMRKLYQALFTHERQISYLNHLLDSKETATRIKKEFGSIEAQNKKFSDLLNDEGKKFKEAGDVVMAEIYFGKAGAVCPLNFYQQLTFKDEHKELPKYSIHNNLVTAVSRLDNTVYDENAMCRDALGLLQDALKYQLSLERYVEHLIYCCFAHYKLNKKQEDSTQTYLIKKILAHMQLAHFFSSSEKFIILLRCFEKQRNRLKKNTPTLKIFQYAAYYQILVNSISHQENISQIPRYLKIMSKIDTSDPEFWKTSSLAKSLLLANSDPANKKLYLEEALSDINKAIELNYDIVYLHVRSQVYIKLDEYNQAKKDFLAIFRVAVRNNMRLNEIIPSYLELQDYFINQLASDCSQLKFFNVEKEREEWADLEWKSEHENTKKFLQTVDILFKRAETASQLQIKNLESEDYILLNWMYSCIPNAELGEKLANKLPSLLISNFKNTLPTYSTDKSWNAIRQLTGITIESNKNSIRDKSEFKQGAAVETRDSIMKLISKVKHSTAKGECKIAETYLIAAFKKCYECPSYVNLYDKTIIMEGCFHLIVALVLEKADKLAKDDAHAAKNLYTFLLHLNGVYPDFPTKLQLDTPKMRLKKIEREEKLKEESELISFPSSKKKKKKKKIKTVEAPVKLEPIPVAAPEKKIKQQPLQSIKKEPKEKKIELMEKKWVETKEIPSIKVTLPPIALDAINRLNKAGARITYAVGGLVCEVIKKINNDRTDIDLVFGCSATGDKETDDKANNALVDEAFKDISEWISNKHGFYKIKLKGSNTTIDLMHSADVANKNLTLLEALKKDSENRDFTMNALYADSEGIVHDPVGRGLEDLEVNRLKSITESEKSFIHDPIRIFRAIYFYTKRECTLTDYMKNTIKNINPKLFSDLLNNQPSKLNVWLRKLLIHGKGTKNFTELFELNVLSKFHPVLAKLVTEFPSDKALILKQLSTMDANYQKTGRAPNFNAIFAFWMALIADRYKEQYKDISEVENDGILFKTNFKSLSDHFKDEPEKALAMKNDLIKKASTFIKSMRDKSSGLNPKAQPYHPGMFTNTSSKIGAMEFKSCTPL